MKRAVIGLAAAAAIFGATGAFAGPVAGGAAGAATGAVVAGPVGAVVGGVGGAVLGSHKKHKVCHTSDHKRVCRTR